jgi:hypothetical protein
MRTLLIYAVGNALLIFYFLYKTIRTRQPIFLLGIPFLIYMDRAIFFEKERYYWNAFTGLNQFWFLGFTLLIVWFINMIWQRGKTQANRQSLKIFNSEIPIILLFVLWLLNTGINLIRFPNISEVLITSMDAASIFLGYVLVRAVVARTDLTVVMDFIKSLYFIAAISALLFFLHQVVHIDTFELTTAYDISFAGGSVRRSTWYFSPLNVLLFSYGLVVRKWNIYIALTWMLAFLAYIFSYTRTYFFGAFIIIICSYLLKSLKFRSMKFIGKLLLVMIGIIIGGWIISFFMPIQTKYLISRITQAFTGFTNETNNLEVRWAFIRKTWKMVEPNFLIGIGSPGITNFPNQFWTTRWVYDSWLVLALQYWGVIGIVLILLSFFSALKLSYKFFVSGDENLHFIGLLFFLILTAILIEGIFGPIFMDTVRFPMGFWYFAFLYGIASNIKRKEINISYQESTRLSETNGD